MEVGNTHCGGCWWSSDDGAPAGSARHGVQSHGRVSRADMQPSRQGGLAGLPVSSPLFGTMVAGLED